MTTGASALFGDLHQVGFSASKMALVGMVNCLSIEGEIHNIRVNSLCPSGRQNRDDSQTFSECDSAVIFL